MKRILSLILTLCIIGTCFSFTAVVNAEETVVITPQEQRAFEFLSALEIMVGDDKGNANLEKNMSRAEFAQLLKNILTYADKTEGEELSGFFDETIWQDNFFGENADADELKFPSEKEEVVLPGYTEDFSDVSTAHWAYDAVKFVRQYGVMNGTSETTFEPDGQVRTNEVIKCLMVMLGYKGLAEVNGGYPTGYLKFAQRLNITNSAPAGEFCTRGAIAVMLRNCMDAYLLIDATYTESGDVKFEYDTERTFATELLGLNKVQGIMTDNGYTALLGKSQYEGGRIVVNGSVLRVPEEKNFDEFIARDVVCWYTNDNTTDPGVAVYVELTGRDSVLEIDGETVTSAVDGYINYKVGKSKNSVRYDDATVIYNGVATNLYDPKEIFEGIDYGTITVVETNSSVYKKVIIVNEFKTWLVSNVNADEKIISNALRPDGSTESPIMQLDFEDPKYSISIYNADGTPATFQDIAKDSVLDIISNEEGNVIKIYISNSAITNFKITQITDDGDKVILSNGEKEYQVTKAFKDDKKREAFRMNDVLTVYLNSQNRIAWAENQAKSDLQLGYILEIEPSTNSPVNKQFYVGMYTSAGMHTSFELAENVRVSDKYGQTKKMTEKEFYTEYGSAYSIENNVLDGICRYTINEEDEISYIEFPITEEKSEDGKSSTAHINGKLRRLLKVESKTIATGNNGTPDDPSDDPTIANRDGYYKDGSINGKLLLDSTVKIFNVDSTKRKEGDNEKAFSVASGISAINDTDSTNTKTTIRLLRVYTDECDTFVGKYVVHDNPSTDASLSTYTTFPYLYVVTKVGGGRFPDDTLGTVIHAKRFRATTSISEQILYIKEDANIVTEAITGSTTKVAFTGNIEPGDIIRIAKDAEGLVKDIVVVWDENGLDANAAYDSGVTQTPGVSPGLSRMSKYSGGFTNTNPFAYSGDPSKALQHYDKPQEFNSGSYRLLAGFPLLIRNNAVKITAYDVIANNGYTEEKINTEEYATEVWPIARIILIDFKDGDITVKTGKAEDIKTFEDFGTNCSRIIKTSRYADTAGGNLIVINGFMEN